ncbi:hypothetical protein [Cellulomonas carbonis]|uniref:Uncharacterized protein n=1 Tax=Cellulomonas carbonis T26 TaxID=947969 RepID=A0A0A0BR77_9CELL|nr:hypothetical protein [Cellulomonas carbonis]KGM09604.1 hypothetical protein N868_01255 [Cellulomonas carbonis T26]GGB94912.1 hypothetical protein GCM10010972_04530 [Cellulomonas carbonis]
MTSRRSVLATLSIGAVAVTAVGVAVGPALASSGRDARISATKDQGVAADADLVETSVRREGDGLVFRHRVTGTAGATTPEPIGSFAGSAVQSYVWPTSLDPATVGFADGSGVLALAATSHPDFDDTPRQDEDGNGATDDDGVVWHAHWVVLVPDDSRGDGALMVRGIPEGEEPDVPATWPGVPLLLDSPGYDVDLHGPVVRIDVPLDAVAFPETFSFDGVTAALRVNADLHDPLLRVEDVLDIASGDLSMPGVAHTR